MFRERYLAWMKNIMAEIGWISLVLSPPLGLAKFRFKYKRG